MPLHEFEHDGDGVLIVDHEHGSITVETAAVEYTFRRPRFGFSFLCCSRLLS